MIFLDLRNEKKMVKSRFLTVRSVEKHESKSHTNLPQIEKLWTHRLRAREILCYCIWKKGRSMPIQN